MNPHLKGWIKLPDSEEWVEVVSGTSISQVLHKIKLLPYTSGQWQISAQKPVPISIISLLTPSPIHGTFEDQHNDDADYFSYDILSSESYRSKERTTKFAVCT